MNEETRARILGILQEIRDRLLSGDQSSLISYVEDQHAADLAEVYTMLGR